MTAVRARYFKLWHGLSGNPIVGIMAHKCDENRATMMGVWTAILEFASTNRQGRGTLKGVDWEVMAHQLGIEHNQFQVILGLFYEYDWITDDKIARWPIEQTNSNERARKCREAKRQREAAFGEMIERTQKLKPTFKPKPAGYSALGIDKLK